MAGPIYELFVGKVTEAWYQLSKEERESLMAKVGESGRKAGAESIVTCFSLWSNEQWMVFGVTEFPDVEAVQQNAQNLYELDWWRYFEGFSMLGTKWPPTGNAAS